MFGGVSGDCLGAALSNLRFYLLMSFLSQRVFLFIVCFSQMLPFGAYAKVDRNAEIQNPIDMLAKRRGLDRTVWKDELAVAPYEAYLVELWDEMRAAENGLQALGELLEGKVEKPKLERSRKLPERIFEFVHNGGETKEYFISSQVKRSIENWVKEGYVVEQSEWSLSTMEFDDEGVASSEVEFALHVKGPNHTLYRRIFRGALHVVWRKELDEEKRGRPRSIDITSLTMLRRSGVTGFEERLWIDLKDSKSPLEIIVVEDVNGDGRVDVVFPANNLIYRNLGGMRFDPEQLVERRELGKVGNALFVDLNLDGDLEYVFALGGQKLLAYKLNAKTRRYDRKPITLWKSKKPVFAKTLTAGDLDGDGYPDLFLGQHIVGHSNGRPPQPFYDDNTSERSVLLQNKGNLSFKEFDNRDSKEVRLNRRTNTASIVDLNADGRQDLFVASDFSGLDLYENEEEGMLKPRVVEWLDGEPMIARSHQFSDFNRDGKLDVFVAGVSSGATRRFEAMGLKREGFEELEAMKTRVTSGNRLYYGNGEGSFYLSPLNSQLARSGYASGSAALDFNNDGYEDLFVSNGFISNETSMDYDSMFWRHDVYESVTVDHSIIMEFQRRLSPMTLIMSGVRSWHPYQNDNLFFNIEAEEYLNIGYLMGVSTGGDGRAVVAEDFNDDGRVDLLVLETDIVESRQRLYLYENRQVSKGKWIGVDLERVAGKSILGARVRVIGQDFESERVYALGSGYSAQPSSRVHFGLGKVEALVALEVVWPDGSITRVDKPALGKYHPLSP